MFELANLTYRAARTVVITLVGGTVLAIGIVMLVFPGPATVVIPIGLAILGLEWAWARSLLRRVKETGGQALEAMGLKSGRKANADDAGPTDTSAPQESEHPSAGSDRSASN